MLAFLKKLGTYVVLTALAAAVIYVFIYRTIEIASNPKTANAVHALSVVLSAVCVSGAGVNGLSATWKKVLEWTAIVAPGAVLVAEFFK
jgi:hypothetical protein